MSDYTNPSARSFGQNNEVIEYKTNKFGNAVVVKGDSLVTITAPNSPITVSTTSTTVLAANASRETAIICNYGSVACFLRRGATAVVGQGGYLAPGGTAKIDFSDAYTGIVTAITASGSTTLSVEEAS